MLAGYRIHIGERATLVRSASSRAYGVVMELSRLVEALGRDPAYAREVAAFGTRT